MTRHKYYNGELIRMREPVINEHFTIKVGERGHVKEPSPFDGESDWYVVSFPGARTMMVHESEMEPDSLLRTIWRGIKHGALIGFTGRNW